MLIFGTLMYLKEFTLLITFYNGTFSFTEILIVLEVILHTAFFLASTG
jgi:hypothetical protein